MSETKEGIRFHSSEPLRSYGPGKFNTYTDRHLYELTLIGCDDETGSVDENGRWYGLLIGPDLAYQGASDTPDVDLNEAEVTFLEAVEAAIVTEDSNGFVYVDEFYDVAEARSAWAEIEAEVAEYHEEAE